MRISRSTLCVTAALALVWSAGAAAQTQGEVIKTEAGAVRGSNDGVVESWKGIPFAAAPIGPLRWRAPQPTPNWSDVREATAYGHDCMQEPFPSDAAPLGTPPAEDCLYLNIWRPAKRVNRKLPVIFWIYGGGFVNGGASPPTYSGAELARQGVVFISFNYRLGRFGTFAHPQLSAQRPDGDLLGNYALMDQIAALRWVKRNAAAFGGDPDNITILGESAGGGSVHMLVTSPSTKGLFSKAAVMSGGNGATPPGNLQAAEAIGVTFARTKGIEANDPEALSKLRALSAEQVTDKLNMMSMIAMMMNKDAPRTVVTPFADGVVAVDGLQAYRSGNFAHVPMLIGATSGDIGGRNGPMITGTRDIETTIARQGVPVYAYRFSYVAEHASPGRPGTPPNEAAGHASDIPFFFNTQSAKYGSSTTALDDTVGKTVSAYLVNFAKTGNPNGTGLSRWSRFDPARRNLIDFTTQGTAIDGDDPWISGTERKP
jgi:para-nitrobenzyl esterase